MGDAFREVIGKKKKKKPPSSRDCTRYNIYYYNNTCAVGTTLGRCGHDRRGLPATLPAGEGIVALLGRHLDADLLGRAAKMGRRRSKYQTSGVGGSGRISGGNRHEEEKEASLFSQGGLEA